MNLDVICLPSEMGRGSQNVPAVELRQSRRAAPLEPTAILQAASRILGRWWRAHRNWRMQRKAIAQLERMSDHDLKDIGLMRDQIAAGVRGDLERDPTLVRRGVRRRTRQEPEARVA